MKDYFRTRCSVRRFSAKPVSDELLNDILRDAIKAPTTGNMQLYSVIISRTPEQKKALAPAHFNQPAATGCALLLTVCADFNRFVHWCRVSGADPGYDNLQSLMTAVLDATIFAQQINTSAEIRGLGCVYLGTTTYNAPDIARELRLPKRVVPIATLAIGWPDEEPFEVGRLPLEAVVHEGEYHNYTDDDIRALYAEKEAREDSRRFVQENGKQSLAQVFTDVRYTRDANEHFSRVLADFLKSQGF